LGRAKTAATVQLSVYWPTWSSDVDAFLRQCEPCAQYHRGTAPHRGEMQVSLVGEPFERISIDIIGPHPKSSRENKFILTLVDHYSKWGETLPLLCHTALVVARVLMLHVFARYGVPIQLLSDRGPEFESDLFAHHHHHHHIGFLSTYTIDRRTFHNTTNDKTK